MTTKVSKARSVPAPENAPVMETPHMAPEAPKIEIILPARHGEPCSLFVPQDEIDALKKHMLIRRHYGSTPEKPLYTNSSPWNDYDYLYAWLYGYRAGRSDEAFERDHPRA